MPVIHREASEPTGVPPAQYITYHQLFMMAFGLLLMLPRAIELEKTDLLILIIIMFHICNKQFKSKHRRRGQGTASTNNLSTKGMVSTPSPTIQFTHKLASAAGANAVE